MWGGRPAAAPYGRSVTCLVFPCARAQLVTGDRGFTAQNFFGSESDTDSFQAIYYNDQVAGRLICSDMEWSSTAKGLLLPDPQRGRLLLFNPVDSRISRYAGGEGQRPPFFYNGSSAMRGLAVHPDGSVFVSNNYEVHRVSVSQIFSPVAGIDSSSGNDTVPGPGGEPGSLWFSLDLEYNRVRHGAHACKEKRLI